MNRVARIVVPGYPHHITQWGNRQSAIFETDADRESYLRFLGKYAALHGLSLWAYCLMTNHIHLVAIPREEHSLGHGLRDAHTVYAMYFNNRTALSGHVWQGRFYSCPLDDAHRWAAVRYVERNPVAAGLVEHAADYRWSSAAAHSGLRSDALLSTEFPPTGVIEDWSAWLAQPEDEDLVERILKETTTGRPCGDASFLDQIEAQLKRSVRPQKRGPKPKRIPELNTSQTILR